MGARPLRVDAGAEAGRWHQPAQAQAGGDRLARGAQVGDALAVEAGQRGDRRHVVAELRVVVVLDEHRLGLAGRGQQRQPLGSRHRAPERVLVGRGDVRRRETTQVGPGRAGRQVDDPAPGGLDGGDGRAVAGVLHPHRPRCQRAQQVAQPVGGADRDPHVVGVDDEPPGAGQACRDLGAQLGQAPRVVVPGWRGGGRDVAPGAAPQRPVARVDPRRAGVEAHGLPACRRGGARSARGWGARTAATRGHEGAGAVPTLEPPLGHQLRPGLLDDAAGHAELGGQRAAARQPLAGAQPAIGDAVADGVGQLDAQRARGGAVEVQGERGHR